MHKKRLVILISLLVVLVLAGIVGYVAREQWYQANIKPPSSIVEEHQVRVEFGSTDNEIADQLLEAGVIRSDRAFVWYLSRVGLSGQLQAGVYRLSTTYSVEEIVDILKDGKVDTRLVTIIPGLRLDQVEDILTKAGFPRSEVKSALKADYDHPLLKDKPKASTLEGYIYPESYQITSETTVPQILELAFETFYRELSQDLLNRLTTQDLSLHQAIILASIVQKEVSDVADMPRVAQVFIKRLNEGIVLGSDVTFFYAAEILGVEPAVNLDSPYNTRINGGLPPGPISNFTIDALTAVSDPADSDFLYFVAGDDGNTYFTRTLQEHEAAVRAHCIELCAL